MYDMGLLFNIINKYYNEFVLFNPQTKLVSVKCNRVVSEFIYRKNIENTFLPPDIELIRYCTYIRNIEEGSPFTKQKLEDIIKKAKYFHKKLDINEAMGYISYMFKEQVWNKSGGYDDLIKKLQGQTSATSGNVIKGEVSSPSSTPSTGGSSGGGMSGY